MKYNELNKYKVRCKIAADVENSENHSSESGYDVLSDYDEVLRPLFESKEEISIKTIEDYLIQKFSYIASVEPID